MLRHRWPVSHASSDSELVYVSTHDQNHSADLAEQSDESCLHSQTDNLSDCEVMASHDRTSEFVSVLRSIRGRQGLSAIPNATPSSGSLTPALQRHSQFLNIARLIGRDISNTYAKLEKLALLAKRRSIFDDRPADIQQLTHIIRQDMTSLNQQLLQLSQLSAGSSAGSHVHSFSSNVVLVLQAKLATMSSEFRRLLEQRTHNMRSQRSRRDQFTCAGTAGAEGPAIGPPAQLRGPQGSVLLSDEAAAASGGRGHTVLDMDGVRERHGLSQDQQQQQQLLMQEEDSYYQSRSDTMKSIESTIVELGTIFQQLAHMVKEQEEVVQRIDSNVEDASVNVEAAHSEILKYFQSVSNNRWLMFKVFGVLIFFFLVFVLFMA